MKIKTKGTLYNLDLIGAIICLLIYNYNLDFFVHLVGYPLSYIFLYLLMFSVIVLFKFKNSSVIILKNGDFMYYKEQEFFSIKSLNRVYESKQDENDYIGKGKSNYYLIFEKENGTIFKLNLLNYSKSDKEYIYNYIKYYGLDVEKIESKFQE